MAKELYSSNAARGVDEFGWVSLTHKVLETSRLILREFVPGDADALARAISDPETMRFYPSPFERAEVEEWIARNIRRYRANGYGLWAVDLKATGEMIGDCGITLQEVDGEHLPEIGYHQRRDMWGQGLATEAALACRDYAFRALEADLLISLIRPENAASCRVAERNGMTVGKETVRVGLRHSVYRISREMWAALPASGSSLRAK
jgi:RimJ/RimL family protein N-acetyltransferase